LIYDQSVTALVPAGAPVRARIVRIRWFYSRPSTAANSRSGRQTPSPVIGVRLETLEIGGKPQPLRAVWDSGLRRCSSLDPVEDRSGDSGIAVFPFWNNSSDYVVKGGPESDWVTRAP